MSLFLQRLSVPSKFAAHLGGVATLTSASLAALAWSGLVRVDVARPELALACLAATGVLASGWTWWVGRTASQPLKSALQLAEQATASVGPVPVTFGRRKGDEGHRLMAHLTQMQERQTQLVRTSVALKAAQEDQQDEMAAWAEDTLRLRSALDATGMEALITDEEGVILFVTRRLAQSLKAHQSAIKAVIPKIDLDRLVGHNLDVFEPACSENDAPLSLTTESSTRLQFPETTYELQHQFIRDRQAGVIGHVVMWQNVVQASSSNGSDAQASVAFDLGALILGAQSQPAHMVDQEGHIAHANQAFLSVLAAHAGSFLAANPSFQSDHVQGCSAGMLYADPDAELSRLRSLQVDTQGRKVLGGRTYDVIEKPLFDRDGQRVGVWCEWVDCTENWLAEQAFSRLAERVASGDFSKPVPLEGLGDLYGPLGAKLNAVLRSMNETSAPMRDAIEQLGHALSQVSQSTLLVQQAIAATSNAVDCVKTSKSNAMLADKAGAILNQMVPAIHHTTELLQEPLTGDASTELALTAAQLQEHASRLQAMVASYRLAVGAKASPSSNDLQSELQACAV